MNMEAFLILIFLIVAFVLVRTALKDKAGEQARVAPTKGGIRHTRGRTMDSSMRILRQRISINEYWKKPTDGNFVAIDFETANYEQFPCQVGIAIVENGEIVRTRRYLIQPPDNVYEADMVNIHGITPINTASCATFLEVWGEMKKYIDGAHVVAHNADFDIRVLLNALHYYDLPFPEITIDCTYKIYNAGLKRACAMEGVELDNHHDAAADARACAVLYIKYLNERGIIANN